MGLLPMVVLAVLNWLIYRAISRARALHAPRRVVNGLASCAAGAYARWSTEDQDWPRPRL